MGFLRAIDTYVLSIDFSRKLDSLENKKFLRKPVSMVTPCSGGQQSSVGVAGCPASRSGGSQIGEGICEASPLCNVVHSTRTSLSA